MKEVLPAALAGERLDRVVSLLTGLPRATASELVAAGGVRIGGFLVLDRSRRLAGGEVLEVEVPADPPEDLVPDPSVEVDVVYVDDWVIVVDKAAGVVVHPGAGHAAGTLVQGLLARYPDLASAATAPGADPLRPGVVHRLDKGTSGLLVVAGTADAYRSLVAQLQARSVERRYLALVRGRVEEASGLVDAPIARDARDPTRMAVSARGRPARTEYRVVERFALPALITLLECRLETGRTHQVRVHLAAIGHPVVGDVVYGAKRGGTGEVGSPRPFLHAHRLAFDHPATGARHSFSSRLPADLDDVCRRLASGRWLAAEDARPKAPARPGPEPLGPGGERRQ